MAEPVSLFDLKAHLRVEHAEEDALIQALILAARQQVENLTGRALVTATKDEAWDAFPEIIELLHTPVSAVTWVKYVADDGTLTTLDAALYRTDLLNQTARISPAYNEEWPSTRRVTNAVQVRYEVGETTVPAGLKRAVTLLAAHWYENRSPVGPGSLGELPHMVRDLAGAYQVIRL
jgi:uncharacterized phiE125 gp8 family phage protein